MVTPRLSPESLGSRSLDLVPPLRSINPQKHCSAVRERVLSMLPPAIPTVLLAPPPEQRPPGFAEVAPMVEAETRSLIQTPRADHSVEPRERCSEVRRCSTTPMPPDSEIGVPCTNPTGFHFIPHIEIRRTPWAITC